MVVAYKHTNSKGQAYYLHSLTVTLRGSGKRQTIYFFSRNVRDGSLDDIPSGYQVIENARTGLPILKKL